MHHAAAALVAVIALGCVVKPAAAQAHLTIDNTTIGYASDTHILTLKSGPNYDLEDLWSMYWRQTDDNYYVLMKRKSEFGSFAWVAYEYDILVRRCRLTTSG